jgi:hypothetical protein
MQRLPVPTEQVSRRLRERARGSLVISSSRGVTGRLNPSGERLLSAVRWSMAGSAALLFLAADLMGWLCR